MASRQRSENDYSVSKLLTTLVIAARELVWEMMSEVAFGATEMRSAAIDSGGSGASPTRRRALLRVALAIITIVTLVACARDGGGPEPLDSEAFQEAHAELERMVSEGRDGDADGAEEAFVLVQPFLRDLDAVLAGMPENLAARAELVDAVVRIELELQSRRRPEVLADVAEDARVALGEVAQLFTLSP